MPTHSPWNALLCCNLSARVDKSNPLTFKEKWFCSCVYFVLAFSVSCILHQRNVTSLNVSTCFVHIIAMKIHSLDRPPPPLLFVCGNKIWDEIRLIHKYVTGKLTIFHTFLCFYWKILMCVEVCGWIFTHFPSNGPFLGRYLSSWEGST